MGAPTVDARGGTLARDLSLLLKLGYPVPEALQRALARAPSSSRAKAVEACQRGASLGEALVSQGLLPAHCRELLAATEEALPQALGQLAGALEQAEQRQRSVRLVVAYPRFLLTLGMILTWLILAIGWRGLAPLMGNARLPLPTQILMALSTLLSHVFGIVAWIALWAGLMTLLSGAAGTGSARLRLPWIGSWIRRNDTVTWMEWLDLSLSVGQSLARATQSAAQACSDPAFRLTMGQVVGKLERGQTLSAALADLRLLSPLALWILQQAEQHEFPKGFIGRGLLALRHELDVEEGQQMAAMEWAALMAVGVLCSMVVMGYMLPLYQLIGNMG